MEIPALGADRPAQPQWSSLPGWSRVSLAASDVLGALEQAGQGDLAERLRALGGQTAEYVVLLSPDGRQMQLALPGTRIRVEGDALKALLALLGNEAPLPSSDPARPASVSDYGVAAREADIQAQLRGSASATVRDPPAQGESDRAFPVIASTVPLPAGRVAEALASLIENSGLFLESHFVAWTQGRRSLDQLRDELATMPGIFREPRTGDERSRAQLDALRNQGVCISGPAWPNQPFQLQVAWEEESAARDGESNPDGARMFRAELHLSLPRLGSLVAKLRVADNSVGLRLACDNPGSFEPHLGALQNGLLGRGLTPIELKVSDAGGGPA